MWSEKTPYHQEQQQSYQNYQTLNKDLEAGFGAMTGGDNDRQSLLNNKQQQQPKPNAGRKLKTFSIFTAFLLFASSIIYFFAYTIPMNGQKHKPVPDLIKVFSLDEEKLPNYNDGSKLLLVGDVHGSYSQLKQLLKKSKFRKNRDHLVLLGDFITKGPRSIDVIELAMELGASCVRGNHENEILEMYSAYHHFPPLRTAGDGALISKSSSINATTTTSDDTYDLPMSSLKLDETDDDDLVRLLKPKHVEFLGKCPLILHLGDGFDRGYEAIAVHAGLMWNVDDLQEQDPETCMTIRSVLPPDFAIPSEDTDGEAWFNLWNEKQRSLPEEDRLVVYYGHAAREGLNLREYTKGLDSGCVKGRQLSGLLISESKKGKYKEKLIQIDC